MLECGFWETYCMTLKQLLLGMITGCILLGGIASILFTRQRIAQCAYVPLLAEELLPNADLFATDEKSDMPLGWVAGAPGAKLGTFALDNDNRSLHLMGIANFIQTPAIAIQPGQVYCFIGHAITDSEKGSATYVRVTFRWLDAHNQFVAENTTPWQPVVLWQQENPPDHWSRIAAAYQAPPEATTLLVQIHPASDDRIYLDVMHVRKTNANPSTSSFPSTSSGNGSLHIHPWPNGNRAALSFSFDWETTMAGLIHSRSVDDPYADEDPVQRGLRMRQGITTTLEIFRPYGIRATYYAAGYTFLMSNTTKTHFLDNPTYSTWATTERGWQTDYWQTTPWFAPDPHGTVQSHPAWYFGDLVPLLQQEQQHIQTHTFSHFYGGYVGAEDWHSDIATWNNVASLRDVPPARSLAFPWSSSSGMSYANWDVLEAAGITSVTRMSDQSQYNLFPLNEHGLVAQPACKPLPGHERMLVCPDIYLTPARADHVLDQVNHTRDTGGVIDIWSHTEEVITDEQRATWQRVVHYVANQPDIWVAPLDEIATWQQAMAEIQIQTMDDTLSETEAMRYTVTNRSTHDMQGLTLQVPFELERYAIDGQATHNVPQIIFDIDAGQTREVQIWPAR